MEASHFPFSPAGTSAFADELHALWHVTALDDPADGSGIHALEVVGVLQDTPKDARSEEQGAQEIDLDRPGIITVAANSLRNIVERRRHS